MRVLAVIATYKEVNEIPVYLMNNLQGWLKQEGDFDLDIVISDNISKPAFDRKMRHFCVTNRSKKKRLHYITHKMHETLFVCMNAGFRFLKEDYDFYIYCSDDTVMNQTDDLSRILQVFKQKDDAGIVSALVDSDHVCHMHPYNKKVGDGSPLKIRLGESVNLHFMCFSKHFMNKYNRKYPDVLISYATETLLTFFCKAIRKEWYICRNVILNNQNRAKRFPKHLRKPGKKKKYIGIIGYGIYKNFKSFNDIFKSGTNVGLGFETWRKHQDSVALKNPNPFWYLPDMSCYDNEEICKNPEALHDYIVNNLYLPKHVMDYDKIGE